MQTECVIPQLKELEQLKLSPSTKSAAADKFITQKYKLKQTKPRNNVKGWDYFDHHQIFIFCQNYFVVKLKLLRNSSDFLVLDVINITFVLRFVKSNKFYYVKTTKVIDWTSFSC